MKSSLKLPRDCVVSEDESSAEFIAELEQFISQLLQIVEVDLSIDVSKNKIREQIHGKESCK